MHFVELMFAAIFIPVCYAFISPICAPGTCQPGTYFDKKQRKCLPCPPGTFMDKTDHKCTDCRSCSRPEEQNHEIEVQKCTAVSDSKIVCKDGYYRIEDSHHEGGECHRCKKCQFWEIEKCKCDLYHDTVCCVNSEVADDTCACDTGTKKEAQDRTGEKRDEQYSRISQETMMNYNYKDDQFSTPVKVFLVLIPFIIVFLVHPVISDAILRWCKKLKRS
ncbi:protein app1 [Biomphalaria glabrata]|uniref:Tumor necrosis factor receptor superfamily member 10C-like isoform X1 n=1 Tax=Biomphalaria glabrata TaxID=6526 RepID=A0A9W2Z5X3_BIOGL|nr:tumor necrosis factor receptor superfamily member 10C-like isoform X1 [Biomphalaria glabrata]KAI8738964.1 protein app1-like; partial [Biomphalaria glabrata]